VEDVGKEDDDRDRDEHSDDELKELLTGGNVDLNHPEVIKTVLEKVCYYLISTRS
jgi:hypothetical protein